MAPDRMAAAVTSATPAGIIPIPTGTAAIIPDQAIPAVLVTPADPMAEEVAMVEGAVTGAVAAINDALPKP
jgi:hypothetical protein